MSLRVQIDISDHTADELVRVVGALANKAAMHNRVAGDAEVFVKTVGKEISDSPANHRSATRLGASPTGHLAQAYAGIESTSDATSAALLVPRASRLRAAFGGYVLTPGPGKTYLTIPVAAQAYGKRAGEFQDLQFIRAGPKKTPILARVDALGNLTTFYVLVKKATIEAKPELIPFGKLENEAHRSIGNYLDDALEATL